MIPIVALTLGFVWWILLVTVWDGSDRFGTVPVPGHKVIHLPAGEVDVAFKDHTTGTGDNDNLNVIPVQLSIRRADHDGADPTVTRASGTLKVVNNTGHQKVAEVQVPKEADYEVTTASQGGGFNPSLLFGKGMSHWNVVWLTLAVAIGSWFVLTVLIRTTRKEPPQGQRAWTPPVYQPQPPAPPAYVPPSGWQPPPPATPPPATAGTDPYARLERLGELHRTGVITDAEFEDQKRKILGT